MTHKIPTEKPVGSPKTMNSNSLTPHSYYCDNSEEEDHDILQELFYASKRKRSSRACDQCRKTKSRCERLSGGPRCANCLNLNLECTFIGPNRKRGPPKGYIIDLEHRVHRLEAIVGIFLSSGEPAVRSLITGLLEDPLAREIVTEVDNGPFGPTGKVTQQEYPQHDPYFAKQDGTHIFVSSRDRRERGVLKSGYVDPSLPSYQWQDSLILKLNSRHKNTPEYPQEYPIKDEPLYAFTPERYHSPQTTSLALPPAVNCLPNLGLHSLATKHPEEAATIWKTLYNTLRPSPDEESDYESDDPAAGQLSLNEKEEIGFLGKTSGMHLLAKPRRKDNLRNGGIWHLPQSRCWPVSIRSRPRVEEELGLNINLPPEHIQNNLLSHYWKYVQPIIPVIDKRNFLEELEAERRDPRSSATIPRLLMLAMFTISARYTNYYPPPLSGTMWEAGCEFLDQAKYILNWTYDSPRPSTCQALVLLAYREFGVGAIPQAWLYIGMAIRMATELGMHRSADRWQLSGRTLLSEAEASLRKRIWHCCILLDRIMAFVLGRPMCIRERDYDTPLPSLDEAEELELWSPRGMQGAFYNRPCHTLSMLQATSSLSSNLALVVDTIYACRSGVTFRVRHIESFKILAHLQTWYDQLPRHLKYLHGDDCVPLPHILTLNMMYWCVVLLVNRPFIRHHSGESSDELAHLSEKSLAESQNAASNISNLVAIYRHSWGLSSASAYLGWLTLTSGIMHVATLTMKSDNQHEARKGLQHCLDALEDMKIVWPSSHRALQLLRGTEVDCDSAKDSSYTSTSYSPPDMTKQGYHYNGQVDPSGSSSTSGRRLDFSPFSTSTGPQTTMQPAELSYFPGYEHWPPELLVFQPHDGPHHEPGE